MKTTIQIITGLIVIVIFAWVVNSGINRQEKVECNTWSTESQQYVDYYITKWQQDQCIAHNITINAPVK